MLAIEGKDRRRNLVNFLIDSDVKNHLRADLAYGI
jgi:hypothetical protein